MELTCSEIGVILDNKYIDASSVEYTLKPVIYEISDKNLRIKSLLPHEMKVKITFDDIRLRSNLSTNKTITFTNNKFFSTED